MLGIIGAMDIEVDGLIQQMTAPAEKNIGQLRFVSGKINGTDCVVAKCGIGKVNAAVCTQTMILEYHPDQIINTGIGGSTSEKTHIGSVVIADRVVQHDFDTTVLGDETGTLFFPDGSQTKYIPCDPELVHRLESICARLSDIQYLTGTVATGDQFIGDLPSRQRIHKDFGAVACEMEGGSIGQVCLLNQVPFAILRSISDDSSGDEGAHVEYAVFARSAAEKAIEIVSALLDKSES